MKTDIRMTALLPMKASSERVPGKNIRYFAGKPLYQHVAEILERCSAVDRIIINTDSEAIAEEALSAFSKVKINVRPESLRGDLVPMNEIIAHDIQTSDNQHFLQTHSTNPLLSLKTLEEAIKTYSCFLDHYDSLFSVTEYKSRFYDEHGKPVNHNPKELLRTQDLPGLYEENSNFYLFSKSSFIAAGQNRIGLKPKMFVVNKLEAVDIDEREDWILAESLFKMRKSEFDKTF